MQHWISEFYEETGNVLSGENDTAALLLATACARANTFFRTIDNEYDCIFDRHPYMGWYKVG